MDSGNWLNLASLVLGAIGSLAGLAYASLLARLSRVEQAHAEDNKAVWQAIEKQRDDMMEVVKSTATKSDLQHAEDRLAAAIAALGSLIRPPTPRRG